MSILLLIAETLCALYVLLMLVFVAGWWLAKPFRAVKNATSRHSFSIIIPARNEAGNIGWLLNDIAHQHFPQESYEVIVVDDFSDDATVKVANGFGPLLPLIVLRMQDLPASAHKAYKKAALAAGIARSKGEWIITTDADCRVGQDWLSTIADCVAERTPVAIAAPVRISPLTGYLSAFQALDFMMMQGITAAAGRLGLGAMSNGANFAFSRAAYDSVEGYAGTTAFASGDDYHLLQKIIRKTGQGAAYLKSMSAIADTPAQPDLKSFLQQRIRWASKSGKDTDWKITVVLMIVYLFNLSLGVIAAASLVHPHLLYILLGLILIKIAAELILIAPVAGFFRRAELLISFPFLQPFHVLYIILAGFLGMVGKYHWKGRIVR